MTSPSILIATMATMPTSIDGALYRLMTWLSPSYPVGGYSYSHGLEYAVETGLVCDAATLQSWVETVLVSGGGRSDAGLFVAAYRATLAGDHEGLDDIAELASAWRGTSEMALESEAQGAAFLATTLAAWHQPGLKDFARRRNGVALAVAVAAACAFHRVPLELALPAHLHAFAANLVSAGVRLIPIGQSDGQRVIARLEPCLARAVRSACETPLDETGTASPLVDWCSMRHETQYTRLFRS
jgi:urease accessory protein